MGLGTAVTVLFFAAAREAAGRARQEVADVDGGSLGDLVERLVSTEPYGPDLEKLLPSCAIWVNGVPAGRGTVLRGGDEVALLPPVSGG